MGTGTRAVGQADLRSLLSLVLLLASASTGMTQTAGVDVTVEYVAGSNIYIDAGRARGLSDGDTVLVFPVDGSLLLGAMQVINASSDKAVLTFAGDPFPVTRGDRLRITFAAVPGAEMPTAGDVVQESGTRRVARDYGPRLMGRLTMDLDLLRSEVRFPESGLESVGRTFAIPALGLRATIDQLPGDLAVNTNLRFAYRYSSDAAIEPEASARVYEANVGKRFGDVAQVQVGRFYNPFERFSGYWDGVLVRFGGRDLGAGVVTGFQPELADEGFNSSLPKYTAFVDYRYRAGSLAYDGDLSFHQVQPRNGLQQHTYFGWGQRLSLGRLRVYSNLQVDRDPADASWTVSELLVNASLPLARRLYLDGRYSRRRPYLIWLGDRPFGERREQAGLGLTYRVFGGFLGADVTANRWEDGGRSFTYSASLAIPRTPVWGLGLGASGSYWRHDGTNALLLAPALSRSFGSIAWRLGYQLYRNGNPTSSVETHAADLQLSFPLTFRTYSSLGAQLRFGDLQSQSLRVTVWTSF